MIHSTVIYICMSSKTWKKKLAWVYGTNVNKLNRQRIRPKANWMHNVASIHTIRYTDRGPKAEHIRYTAIRLHENCCPALRLAFGRSLAECTWIISRCGHRQTVYSVVYARRRMVFSDAADRHAALAVCSLEACMRTNSFQWNTSNSECRLSRWIGLNWLCCEQRTTAHTPRSIHRSIECRAYVIVLFLYIKFGQTSMYIIFMHAPYNMVYGIMKVCGMHI